ncbi:MAG TPA: hypothetical protein VN544_07155 [Gaiellaceae bacterium]|jgi:hypothetical protein|nr:hypothetical protein [Gaiellaceae bacterium]
MQGLFKLEASAGDAVARGHCQTWSARLEPGSDAMTARVWVPLVIVLWVVVSICLLLIALGPRA